MEEPQEKQEIKVNKKVTISTDNRAEHIQIAILKTDWDNIVFAINNIKLINCFDIISLLSGISFGCIIDVFKNIYQNKDINFIYISIIVFLWILYFLLMKTEFAKYINQNNIENKVHHRYLIEWTTKINNSKKE